MMYKKILLTFICLICILPLSFSQNEIKGIVCETDSTSIPYANVILLSQDSIIAKCISTPNGFVFTNIPKGEHKLNISYVGYKIKNISFNVKSNTDLGYIILESGYNLNEVAITASRKSLSFENGILKIMVKNSHLSSLPTIEYLLSSIPGVSFNDGKIKYFGKGEPLILINGNELKSEAQLNALQPAQIAEITVDTNPGAKYDPRYSSVINIKTTLEKPALLVYHTSTLARHYSNNTGINSQLNINKIIIDLSYRFRKRVNESYSIQQEESFQPNYLFKNIFQDTILAQRLSHDWSVNLYRKLKKSSINVEYSGYYSINDPIYQSLSHTNYNLLDNIFIVHQTGKYKECQNTLSLNYSLLINKTNNLKVTADYLHQTTKDRNNTIETGITTEAEKKTQTDFVGKYDIVSSLVEYTHAFNDKISLLSGVRYSNIRNNNQSWQNATPIQYNLRENRYAIYLLSDFTWKKVSLQLGVRGEKTSQQYHYNSGQNTTRKNLFFLPSFSVVASLSKTVRLSLSGNRKISLPSFNQLTPIITYFNQYSYSVGNPLLEPAIIYNTELNITLFDKLNLSMGYSQTINDRIYIAKEDQADNQIIKYTYDNINKSREYTGMITYSDAFFKCHNLSLSAGILFPNSEIPYFNGFIHYTKPTYFTQLFYNWRIGTMINFSISYKYQSISYDKADIMTETHNLQSNISVSPIKDKLFISLQVSDILRKANSDWQTKYGYFKTQQFNDYDNQNITFSIRYRFNSFKQIKKSSSNEEETNRL